MFLHSFNKDRPPLPEISAAPMKTAFASGEVQAVIKQLKRKRNCNNLWWNCKNWKTLNEINQGVLTVIQKSGKPKGSIENLRPITLLSMLRKSLEICLAKRMIYKLDAEIPPSQAMYRQERSTNKHVFATKISAEKATTSKHYKMHLLMLDMSKASDTVDRAIPWKNLKAILNPNKLHLIKTMLNAEWIHFIFSESTLQKK